MKPSSAAITPILLHAVLSVLHCPASTTNSTHADRTTSWLAVSTAFYSLLYLLSFYIIFLISFFHFLLFSFSNPFLSFLLQSYFPRLSLTTPSPLASPQSPPSVPPQRIVISAPVFLFPTCKKQIVYILKMPMIIMFDTFY